MGCGSSSLDTIQSTESKCSAESSEALVITAEPNKPLSKNVDSSYTESPKCISHPVVEEGVSNTDTVITEVQTSASSFDTLTDNFATKEVLVRLSYKDMFDMNQQGGMLNFSTFLRLARVRQVLASQVMNLDGILGLFQIYDKDEDKRLQKDEFVDLMDIIDLSYGHLLDDGSLTDTNSEHVQHASVASHQSLSKPAKRLTYKGPDIKSLMQDPAFTASPFNNPNVNSTEEATEPHNLNGNTIINSDDVQLSARKTNLAPIGDKEAFSQQLQHLLFERRLHPYPPLEPPVTPTPSIESNHHYHEEVDRYHHSAFQSPPSRPLSVKKGFMLKKDGNADSPTSRNSRFFTLNDGTLTYYDSTCKSPPFSIDRKSINLSGMNVTVVGDNILQLQRDLAAESTESSHPSRSLINREVLSLQIKNVTERDDWIAAIQEHIDFSASQNHANQNAHSNPPGRLFHQLQYDYLNNTRSSEVGAV
mmetsp:Transcript_2451/g.3404  ORF Transcript_2451/g.3404 Transcript_2451/m.3404 type:complete len:476 (+) Transcript_2451:118-1545(+)